MNKVRLLTAPLLALIKLHWIALCIAAGAILLYTLAGFFLVPYVARMQMEKYVTQTLHRQVSIGEMRFNPFVLDASVSNFDLREADGSPLVSFRHLYANAQLASLWRRAIVLHEVQLSAPNIELVIEKDASVNLAKLFPPSPEPEEPSEPTAVRIGNLSVHSGRIGVADYTLAEPFKGAVTPIRFALDDFRTDANFENAYDFSGTTTAGEQLAWTGEFTVRPLGSNGRFSVRGLQIATIESYIKESIPFRLASGQADIGGTYRFALDPAFSLDVTLPSAQIRELSLAERTGNAAAPIVLPAIDVQEVQFSYAKRDVGLKLVEVKDARIAAAIERDGSISLMRLFGVAKTPTPTLPRSAEEGAGKDAPHASSPPPLAGEGQGGGAADNEWRIHIDSIRLANAALTAEDRSVNPATKFELAPVQVTLNDWSTDDDAKLQIDSDITINKRGRLLAKGDLQLTPLTTQLAIDLKDFDLPVLQPYIAKTTAMTLHSGRLGAKGDVTYASAPESAQPVTFKGEVQVADLRTTDQLVNEDFLKWRSLALTGIDFSLHPDKLSIDRIVARQPYARVVIAQDSSLNITRVLNPDGPVQAPETTDEGESQRAAPVREKEKVFPVRIGTVQFIDGSANFADYSIEPSFATGILSLNGSIVGLSSAPASRAKVKLDGKVDKYAPVDINGEVNLLSASVYTDLAMNFRNMELTTFNPYSGKFAGYNISKGKLSTELRYKVQDRKLDAAHHIVLDNLEFGAKTDSKDAAPIPLKLAVALLKDRHGVIDVNLPVTGTLDDPKFRLGPIIWKAVLGLLTKIVTAPFAALGALFGGGDELAYVDFAPGTAVLAPTEIEKLNTLSRALVERPQLKLNVPLTVVAEADGAALAQERLAATLPPPGELTDDRARRKRVAELEKAYRQIVNAAPEYPPETKTDKGVDLDAQIQFLDRSLLERLQPDDAALTELGRQRARAVQDALLVNTELNPERVFITSERSEGKSQNESVRMEMQLE
ncbi:MAG TPA: DUF748 domain-containing protein [Povalibacter sp.]|uniref:DUF748 domain-containing protein n=1 Tax=Povalibacter sp. TaxID=1962978 RepID=UPI002B89B374|nr:DUF748 domain-containing protein [Povalibacter sp.]HMN45808.1 DUF748 domain-containing protein [Povalibacter sp.]